MEQNCGNCKYRIKEQFNCSHRIMKDIHFGVKVDEKQGTKCQFHEYGTKK